MVNADPSGHQFCRHQTVLPLDHTVLPFGQPVVPFDHTGLPVITVDGCEEHLHFQPYTGFKAVPSHCDDRQASVIKRQNRLIKKSAGVAHRRSQHKSLHLPRDSSIQLQYFRQSQLAITLSCLSITVRCHSLEPLCGVASAGPPHRRSSTSPSTTQKIRSINRQAQKNDMIKDRLDHWKADMRYASSFLQPFSSRCRRQCCYPALSTHAACSKCSHIECGTQ